MEIKFVSINGIIQHGHKAVLPVDHIEFTYGFGVYENIRFRNGYLYFMDAHIERLFNSARIIGLTHSYTEEQLRKWIIALIKKNKQESANIKILLIGGAEPKLYIMQLAPKFVDKKLYKTGVRAITKQYERFLPQAKTLNMLASYLFYKEASEQKAYDAILYDTKGRVQEGTRSNIFFIKGKTLCTPPENVVLSGVTRATVIECAQEHGFKVMEKQIQLANVMDFDCAFFTNTSGKIVPIKEIDGKQYIVIPELLSELMKAYNEFVESKGEKIL